MNSKLASAMWNCELFTPVVSGCLALPSSVSLGMAAVLCSSAG